MRCKKKGSKELKIEEMKLEMKKKNEDKDITVNRNIYVKSPELVTTKSEGTHLDWFQFWNPFETEIEKIETVLKVCFSI